MAVSPRMALRRLAPGGAGAAAICLFAALVPLTAQDERPPEEALASLQERGRLIALYLQAVDRAAELLKAQRSNAPRSDRTVVVPEREGWRVVYLEESAGGASPGGPGRKGPTLVAETTFSPDSGIVGTLGLSVPPRAAPATIQAYARSLSEAEAATLSRPDGGKPCLDAVLREPDGTFTVYVISQRPEEECPPAAESAGSVLFGRDFMVRVAATGRQVLSVERLHDSLSTLSLQPRAPGVPLLHPHDKGDLPAPTDVAMVLRHRVIAPLLVLTKRFMFRIDREGAVTWLGANPDSKSALGTSPTPAAPGGGGVR
jgi:hypothetical protein